LNFCHRGARRQNRLEGRIIAKIVDKKGLDGEKRPINRRSEGGRVYLKANLGGKGLADSCG